jgi:hypothetical protein
VRSALIGALILVTAACARPTSTAQQILPTPSPSPTPTTPLVLTATAPFHNGEVGVAYAPIGLSATGGVQPYTWTISDGQLPAGLALASDGTVSGTPTSAGTFAFTVQVADAGNSTATIPGSVPIAAALSASLISACATQCSVELGCVSVCGAFGGQSGGVEPYSYTVTSGQLPAGTSLSGLTLTGTFVGSSGYLLFTVQVTDGFGATASVTPKFWMYDHISLSGGTCYSTYYLFPCNASLPYSGGIPGGPPTVSVLSASGSYCIRGVAGGWVCNPSSNLPPNFSATVSGGSVIVSVPASPNSPFEYNGTVTLGLTDQDQCGSGTYCSTGATVQVTFAGG